LAPGDIIQLLPGDIVPADARVIFAQNAFVDESVVSGESVPAPKTIEATSYNESNASSIFYSDTTIITGKARAIIIGTGINSTFGAIGKYYYPSFSPQ